MFFFFFLFFFFFFFFFLTVLFGGLELVRDSQNPSDKETFFCFLARFYTSKYLRVMELRDTNFMVRGGPMGSCCWSNLWLVFAQHGVEPALTAIFQRSAH